MNETAQHRSSVVAPHILHRSADITNSFFRISISSIFDLIVVCFQAYIHRLGWMLGEQLQKMCNTVGEYCTAERSLKCICKEYELLFGACLCLCITKTVPILYFAKSVRAFIITGLFSFILLWTSQCN